MGGILKPGTKNLNAGLFLVFAMRHALCALREFELGFS